MLCLSCREAPVVLIQRCAGYEELWSDLDLETLRRPLLHIHLGRGFGRWSRGGRGDQGQPSSLQTETSVPASLPSEGAGPGQSHLKAGFDCQSDLSAGLQGEGDGCRQQAGGLELRGLGRPFRVGILLRGGGGRDRNCHQQTSLQSSLQGGLQGSL